ncbi:MAG: hypothetical protein DRJ51_09585, partial [Thermoprotei archaeon]
MRKNANINFALLYGLLYSSILSFITLRYFLINDGYIKNPESVAAYPYFADRTSVAWDYTFQQPSRIELLPFYHFVSLIGFRAAYFIVLTVMLTVTYLAIFSLLKAKTKYRYLISFLATPFMLFNPIMWNEIFHLETMYNMGLFALFFYISYTTFRDTALIFKDGIKKLSVRFTISRSIIIALILANMTNPHIIMHSLIILFWTIVVNFVISKRYIINMLMLLILISLIYIPLYAYVIIPYIYKALLLNTVPSPSYVLSHEVLALLSRKSSLLNVFKLTGLYWFNPYKTFYCFNMPKHIWQLFNSSILMLLAVILTLPMLKKVQDKLSISLITLVMIYLILGTGVHYEYLSSLYSWLVFASPLSAFGWIFRNSARFWSLPLPFIYSILISKALVLLEHINNQFTRRAFKLFFIIVLVLCYIAASYPLVNNECPLMIVQPLPHSYKTVCSIFETENYTKIFIIPEEPYWGAPLPILKSQHSIIGYNYDRVLSSFLKEILFTNKTNKLGKILSHAGVGFVLVNASKDLGNILISRLHDQLDLRAYFTMNSLHIYKNTQLTKYLYP